MNQSRQNSANPEQKDNPIYDSILTILNHAGLTQLVLKAIHDLNPEKIMLFGSRARGTAQATSDFDLALFLPIQSEKKWSLFFNEATESPDVLFRVDWVNVKDASKNLLDKILTEGIILYEKNKLHSSAE